MNAFTPGPWVANLPSAVVRSASDVESTYHVIADISFSRDADGRMDSEAEANCRLIAAAPRLLAVAESALEDLEGFSGDDDYWARVATLRAAIRQARGDK